MDWQLINEGPQRTFALIFEAGDEVVAGLTSFARETKAAAAEFTALGALSDAVLGYFDWQKKDYRRIAIDEQVEVVSLVGNFALGEDAKPMVHPHIVIAKSDGTAHGGHLLQGHVRPTLEVVVVESPAHLQRRHDAASGLALISVGGR